MIGIYNTTTFKKERKTTNGSASKNKKSVKSN